jgi:phage baseplate assembly protein W
MAKEFLGSGWRFPILPDARGGLGYVAADDNVEQSLRILLETRVGERVMRPTFGTDAPALVFAPGSAKNLTLLETTVKQAIVAWEPRVDVLDVSAELDAADATRALVSVTTRVRQSNTKLNLVFPFYLETEGA